jgi:hypothetical protein
MLIPSAPADTTTPEPTIDNSQSSIPLYNTNNPPQWITVNQLITATLDEVVVVMAVIVVVVMVAAVLLIIIKHPKQII